MLSFARTRVWHEWKVKQLAFREYARRENLRRYNRQHGFIINPYSFGTPAGSDPYFANVVSLLHLDGTNNTDGPYTDVTGKTWARVSGGGAVISTSQQKWGTASLLTSPLIWGIKTADATDWDFGSGDFTLELWAYQTASSADVLLNKEDAINFSPFQFVVLADGTVIMRCSTDGTTYGSSLASSTGVGTTNAWQHWGFCRSSGTLYGFIDGTSIGTVAISGALTTNTDGVTVGSADVAVGFTGFIDDFRATKGVARYTANFTPPAAVFPDS